MKSRHNIFDEICRDIYVKEQEEIRSLDKNDVSKDSVCHWLESVCGLLEQICIPTLYEAMVKCDKPRATQI